MNVLGIISEYNPFHNGHLHHVETSKQLCNADYCVCVMSGSFTQRGDCAIIDKWSRAEAALHSGVDLVIELPCVYSISSAEYFAYGAVKLLNSFGLITHMSFGSEYGQISMLNTIANILYKEDEFFKINLKKQLDLGLSFAASRQAALSEYFRIESHTNGFHISQDDMLKGSNNILAIEYLKALKKTSSSIEPFTIKRVSNDYNQKELTGSISSATSIREKTFKGDFDTSELRTALPSYSYDILQREFTYGRGPVCKSSFDLPILTLLRKTPSSEIKKLPYVSEGLENRLKKASLSSTTIKNIIDKATTKRYPASRISRILMNLLLGITNEELMMFQTHGGPQYIRILGMNEKGQFLLKQSEKAKTLPIFTKTAAIKKSCNPLVKKMFDIECRATDIFVLGFSNYKYSEGGSDFTHNPVTII